MVTYNNGDVLSAEIYNPTANPQFALPDRSNVDDAGIIDLVVNENLSNDPDQIKAHFYGFYNRIQVSVLSDLTVKYSSAQVVLSNGQVVSVNAGNLVLPASSNRFLYVSSAGLVESAPTLPDECIPLAVVVTGASEITSLIDLRHQINEQVRPVRLPAVQSPWVAGDTKVSFRNTPEPGWLLCDGSELSVSNYTALFAAIGYTHGGGGATFRLPDCQGRALVGAGAGVGLTPRALGQVFGEEAVVLNAAQIPSHAHGVFDPGHSHSAFDSGHSHTVDQTPHAHGVVDPGHNHNLNYKRSTSSSPMINVGGAELSQAVGDRPIAFAKPNTTGIQVAATNANLSIRTAQAAIGVNQSVTGINGTLETGGNGAHSNMSPGIAASVFIRAI